MVKFMTEYLWNDLSNQYFELMSKSYQWMMNPISKTRIKDHGLDLQERVICLDAGRMTGKSPALKRFVLNLPKNVTVRYYAHNSGSKEHFEQSTRGRECGATFYTSRTFMNSNHENVFRGMFLGRDVFIFEECGLTRKQIIDQINVVTHGVFTRKSPEPSITLTPVIIIVGIQ